MLTVDDYELIRREHLVDGMSQRAIARELGHARNTVVKPQRVGEVPTGGHDLEQSLRIKKRSQIHQHRRDQAPYMTRARQGFVELTRGNVIDYDVTTTARYLDHNEPGVIIEAMRTRSWSGA